MFYINTATNEYPLTAIDIKQQLPNTSFPVDQGDFDDAVEELGYVKVQLTTKPNWHYTKNIVEGTPELVDGVYLQTWVVSDATEDQITARTTAKALEVREERNQLLTESDWTQLDDSPVDRLVWSFYRGLLRDLTDQEGFPWQVVWPDTP